MIKQLKLITSSSIGDIAEFLFDARAIELGYIVTRPVHAGTVYDRVIDNGEQFFRVQIKCIWNASKRNGKYRLYTRRRNDAVYKTKDVDVIAAYVKEENSWYILANKSLTSVMLRDTYKEKWDIFETVQGHKKKTSEGMGVCRNGL